MNLLKKAACVAGVAALAASTALTATAATTNLRIQTHFSEESPNGKLAAEFIDNIQTMSGGDVTIEMFYSSSVVTSVETFDAAATDILDCDMTGDANQTGKNPAFQFVGDIMGGYDSPWDQYSWLYNGGGYEAAQDLYNKYDMQFIGWWIPGMESLSSSKPIRNAEDFKNWKFVTMSDEDLISVFNSLKTDIELDSNLGTSHVFIIDRKGSLRGRDDMEGTKFGYDSRYVADINNNMVDDVKVILAEYRMALKKNNIYKDQL